MKTLILGGVRSGKSFHAESLVVAATDVTYVAPGPPPDRELDPDWAARVEAHRERRPEHWRTVETVDLERASLFVPAQKEHDVPRLHFPYWQQDVWS